MVFEREREEEKFFRAIRNCHKTNVVLENIHWTRGWVTVCLYSYRTVQKYFFGRLRTLVKNRLKVGTVHFSVSVQLVVVWVWVRLVTFVFEVSYLRLDLLSWFLDIVRFSQVLNLDTSWSVGFIWGSGSSESKWTKKWVHEPQPLAAHASPSVWSVIFSIGLCVI